MWNKSIKFKRDFKRKYKHKRDKFDTYTKYYLSEKGIRLKNDRIKDLKYWKNHYNRLFRRKKIELDEVGFKSNYYIRYYRSIVWDKFY